MGDVSKGMRPEGWPRILFRLAGNASLSEEAMLQRPKMSTKDRDFIPARTSPGKTRPALPAKTQGESAKSAMGGAVTLRVGSVNVGTMRGREGEVVEMAPSRHLDFCCLQETGWKGEGARKLGRYKFFWMGREEGYHGVGVLVAEEWIEKVLDVKRWSERIMVLRVVVGRSVGNLISVYAPQTGRSKEEKEEFFTVLGKILSDIDVGERLLICGDMNGHVGAEVDDFEGVHGGYGFGRRNVDGEMLLEFADALDFAVVNTWFKKEVRKMITYETKACKTVIDFFLIRKSERKLVRDVKVVHEECIKQHKLLICVLDLKEKLVRSKVKFMKRCKVWKLKEAETEGIFRQRVQARVAMQVDKPERMHTERSYQRVR